MKLKTYGGGDSLFTLSDLISHLEELASNEEETLKLSGKGLKWKRHEIVEDAVRKLNAALEFEES